MKLSTSNAGFSKPTITVLCNSSTNELVFNADDIALLEKAITELYISKLLPNLSRKLTRKMCIKINSWREAINDFVAGIDCSINHLEVTYILSSIQVLITTIPHAFVSERLYAHAMLKRFRNVEQSSLLQA
jgi:hypothetical protein